MDYSGRHAKPGLPEKVAFNLRPKVSTVYQAGARGQTSRLREQHEQRLTGTKELAHLRNCEASVAGTETEGEQDVMQDQAGEIHRPDQPCEGRAGDSGHSLGSNPQLSPAPLGQTTRVTPTHDFPSCLASSHLLQVSPHCVPRTSAPGTKAWLSRKLWQGFRSPGEPRTCWNIYWG